MATIVSCLPKHITYMGEKENLWKVEKVWISVSSSELMSEENGGRVYLANKLQNVCWVVKTSGRRWHQIGKSRVLKVVFERKVDLWVSLTTRRTQSERVGVWRVGNETEKIYFSYKYDL